MVIFHQDREYLNKILIIIKKELRKINLEVNSKTKIYKSNENINYLGRRKNKRKSKEYLSRRKLKKRYDQYFHNEIKLSSLISSINSINSNKYFKGDVRK